MSVWEESITTSKSPEMLKSVPDRTHQFVKVFVVVETLHEKHGVVSLLFDDSGV